MKKITSILLIALVCTTVATAQKEHFLSMSLSSGAGGSAQILSLGDITYTNNLGDPIATKGYKVYAYGYHIPVSLRPIMYGTRRWRIGLDVSYQYNHFSKLRYLDLSSIGTAYNGIFLTDNTNSSTHTIKAGLIFEYDFLIRNKSTLGFGTGLGYYSIVKSNYNPSTGSNPYATPYIYGNLGLQASYSIGTNWKLLYGISTDIEGSKYNSVYRNPMSNLYQVTFLPRVTVGIRKDFALKGKKKS